MPMAGGGYGFSVFRGRTLLATNAQPFTRPSSARAAALELIKACVAIHEYQGPGRTAIYYPNGERPVKAKATKRPRRVKMTDAMLVARVL